MGRDENYDRDDRGGDAPDDRHRDVCTRETCWHPKPKITRDLGELVQLLTEEREWAFDYETTGFDWMTDRIKSVSFGFSRNRCAWVPFVGPSAVPWQKFVGMIAKPFGDPTKSAIVQNGKFDFKFGERAGLHFNGEIIDTCVAAWCLNENEPSLRLKELIPKYYRHRMVEYEEVHRLDVPQGNLFLSRQQIEVEWEDYNCEDSFWTRKLWYEKQLPKFQKEPRLFKIFKELECRVIRPLMRMELHGVKVDVDYLIALEKDFEQRIEEVEKATFEIVGRRFNAEAAEDVAHILFDELGAIALPDLKRTKPKPGERVGRYSTDVSVLEKYASYPDERVAKFVHGVLKSRSLRKLKNTYCQPLVMIARKIDGRIRTTYNQVANEHGSGEGTVTGRLSCVDGDTVLITDQGPVPIAGLRADRGVWYRVRSHTGAWRRIKRVIFKGVEDMYVVCLASGATITCTGAHRFLASNGEWKALADCVIGTSLSSWDGAGPWCESAIVGITPVGPRDVWDVEVEEDDSYLAQGFVNHNSSEPNLQNIPVRKKEWEPQSDSIPPEGKKIRQAFISDDEWELLVMDFSQIELRFLAHVSQDKTLLEAYRRWDCAECKSSGSTEIAMHACPKCGAPDGKRNKKDPKQPAIKGFCLGLDLHTITALKCNVDRDLGKIINFALIYGLGNQKFAAKIKKPFEESKRIRRAYFQGYPGVTKWHESIAPRVKEQGFVTTVLGRKRRFPGTKGRGIEPFGREWRQAANAEVQGSAADLMKVGIRNCTEEVTARGWDNIARAVLTVHDEYVWEVRKAMMAEVQPVLVHEMETALKIRVPILCGVGTATKWGEAKA